MAQPPGTGGVVGLYEVRQQGEANVGNIMVSNGNGVVQDTGISSTAPSFMTLSLTNLPTADPHVAGTVWSNAGILTVSAG